MKVQELHINSSSLEHLRGGAAAEVESAAAGEKTRSAAPVGQDRVEISAAARAATSGKDVREVEFARKALLGIPPLSQERVMEILSRIRDQYYSRPEVIREYASRLTADLVGVGA